MTSTGRSAFWALLAASLPMFMGALDNLVVTTALSTIAHEFHTTQAELQWVVNGYTLPFSGALLAGAVLGDRIGRRRVFLAGITLFTIASVACALAGTPDWLIFARALQGTGAGLILPTSLTLAVAAVRREQRNMAVGVWGAVNGIGIAVGPLAGGLVTEGLHWSWIFWLNVPFGLIAIPLVLWALPDSRGTDRDLNVRSLVLIVTAVVVAVWGIVQAADHGWNQPAPVLSLLAAAVLAAGFAINERRAAQPLIPVRMYRIRDFWLSNGVAFALYFGIFGSIFFIAQFLQGPMGFTPLEAGVRTLPWTAAPMIVVPITSALVGRFGPGILQAVGMFFQAVALAWIAVIATPDVTYLQILPTMILAGIGMGLVFGSNPASFIGAVDDTDHNKASGVNNTVREFGGALGVAVLTAIFTFAFAVHGGGDPARAADSADAFIAGFQPALWLGAVVCLIGGVIALFIRKPAAVVTEASADSGIATASA